MSDKAIYSVDTVETITDNDKIYVNTGDNIKQIKRSDLFIDINSNLGDYGLDNKFDGELQQGYYKASDGTFLNSTSAVCSKNYISCKKGDNIRIKTNTVYGNIYAISYDSDGTFLGNLNTSNNNDWTFIEAHDNVAYIKFDIIHSSNITPQTVGAVSVYVNNEIDELKNDLDRIEGIITTEQIVGTFLGKNLYRNTIVLNFSTPFTVASGNNDTCIDSSGGMVSQASSYEGNIPWGSIDTLVNAESFVETSSYRFTNPFIFKKDKTGYWYCRNMYGETIPATKIVLTLYYTK